MFTEQLLRERRALEGILKYHKFHLNDNGILLCQKEADSIRWVHRYELGGRIYNKLIRKKNREQAQELAINHYRLVMIEDLKRQITALDDFLQGGRAGQGASVHRSADNPLLLQGLRKQPRLPAGFLRSDSPYSGLILPYLRQEYGWAIDWYLSEYPRNTDHPEALIIPTEAGIPVRSKSEALVVNRLFREGVLFHYEEELVLPGDTVYPDWTFRLSRVEKIIWEHYGAMDKSGYNFRTRGKHLNYLEGQWLPGVNMITTYESKDHPFSEEDAGYAAEWLLPRYRAAFPELPPDGSFSMYDLIRSGEEKKE